MNYKKTFELAQEKGYKCKFNWPWIDEHGKSHWDLDYFFLECCWCQKWLRDEHDIHVVVNPGFGYPTWYIWRISVRDASYNDLVPEDSTEVYEEALAEGIKEALKLLP